jgi:hypothetical protein
MIRLEGNGIYFDIDLGGQRITEEFAQLHSVEVYAFRMVSTAGFAIPTIQFHIGSTNEAWLRKFNEQNEIKIYVGSSPDNLDCFSMDIVGHHIRKNAQLNKFILECGGCVKKEKLSSMFLKDRLDNIYRGNALSALQTAWKDLVGTEIDSNLPANSYDLPRMYKRHRRTLNNYLVEILLYADVRPSFPLVAIDRYGRLILRDFQKIKAEGYKHTFAPANPATLKPKEIPYVGSVETVSYKTYVNRFTGYTQITTRNTKTGELVTIGSNLTNEEHGWKQNSLATTLENTANPIEHRSRDIQNVLVDDTITTEHQKTYLHNKNNLLNMSSVSAKILVQGQYLNDVNVLDIIKIKTQRKEDRRSGLYIIEAIEQGFVYGGAWSNAIWLCRDNENDIETTVAEPYKRATIKELNIDPKVKAEIANMARRSRQSMIYTKDVLSGDYFYDYQRYLISMRTNTLTNFSLYDTNLNLTDQKSTISSMKSTATKLVNRFIKRYIDEPYASLVYNRLLGNSNIFTIFTTILSALFGAEIYGAFYQMFSDMNSFYDFLNSRYAKVSTASLASSDSYVSRVATGAVVFSERADGTLEFYTEDLGLETTLEELGDTMSTAITSTDNKSKLLSSVVAEIQGNIPNGVDIPIPQITLSDSDAVKPADELKNDIANIVVEDLIKRGYVYDPDSVTTNSSKAFISGKGEILSSKETRANVLSATDLKEMLVGNKPFDAVSIKKLKQGTGSTIHVRHWGTFSNIDDLTTYIVSRGFTDKYKTVNTVKRLSVPSGKRIYVALPTSETNVKFYINSERVNMSYVEVDGLGYFDSRKHLIPYTIYYTPEGYNSSNVTLELRKEIG